jgi:pimeloyl-ACP methyl ester carboxylesterase
MREHRPRLETPDDDHVPSVVIEGLLSGKDTEWLYKPLVDDGLDWNMPPEKRCLYLPNRGLGDINDMHLILEEQVLEIQEDVGRPVVIAGHSMGAIASQTIALNNPEIASDVLVVAGAHAGQRYETVTTFLLRHALILSRVLKDPGAAATIKHDSPFIKELVQRVETEWPENVGLHGISTTFDDLLPFTHGLELKLPKGRQAEKGVIALPIPGLQDILRFMMNDKHIRHIPSLRPALHFDIIRHPKVIDYVRTLQGVQQENVIELNGNRRAFAPAFVPAAAA